MWSPGLYLKRKSPRISLLFHLQNLPDLPLGCPGRDVGPVIVTTNADGIAETQLAPSPTGTGDLRIVARNGADVAAVVPWGWGSREEWSGYIYTDRPVYRPGHTVRFKASLRVRAPSKRIGICTGRATKPTSRSKRAITRTIPSSPPCTSSC